MLQMKLHVVKFLLEYQRSSQINFIRFKTISAQYVARRARDATFEKLMDQYKNFLKVIAVQDLILANPTNNPTAASLDFLSRLSQKLHLNRGAVSFLQKYPHIFHIFYDPIKSQPFCRMTDVAVDICRREVEAVNASLPIVVDRLVRLLSMSSTKSLPLRAIFKVWKELGLPDDFEDSVISQNPHLFRLSAANEPNTHVLELVDKMSENTFTAAVENWRVIECCKEENSVDRTEMRFSFKQSFPPGMRLSRDFKAKVKEWQRLSYVGPYEELRVKKNTKAGIMRLEKRAVSFVHEFLSLTVEKTVEVEKISHFRKPFGIDMNIRDLFLDHPGIFYMSTKGKRHTVFLREAYERGCLVETNPVYDVRRKLFNLVLLGRRGMGSSKPKSAEMNLDKKSSLQEENSQ